MKFLGGIICSLIWLSGQTASAQPLPTYESETLLIKQVSDRVYQHTSYLNSESFGKVPCNGMLVVDEGQVIIFDTPADSASSAELLRWLEDELEMAVVALIATHFHDDCLAGLDVFHAQEVPSYAHALTLELAKAQQKSFPQNSFQHKLKLKAGDTEVWAEFVGEGHTRDNVVGYVPEEETLFGGCLIKEVGAGKGNLADAHVAAWAPTVRRLKATFPNIKTVIPGHGRSGGPELLDYTIDLFK